MKIIFLWHTTRGKADQYFICSDERVLFQIPKFIGRLFIKGV